MKKASILLVGFLFIMSSLVAQEKVLSENLPTDPNVRIGILDNGLTYYAQSNPKPVDKIELRLVVNAGSVLENDNQVGLAHFMEHMCFNGTKNFKKNELVDYLQSIGVKFGADLNAYTSFDETVYILPIPCDNPETLERGFQVIEDWAHNATLTEEAIDDERGVVLEEYRLGLGSSKRMLKEYLPKLMYGSRYADRLPIGTKENLENFKYEDVRSFYREWYRPSLMAVIAVGDLPVEEIEQKIKDHFAGIKKHENPKKREEFGLPNHKETFISVATDKEAPFSNVQLMYKDREEAKPFKTYADYRERLVIQVFSRMINNRLNEKRNEANPPFVFAGTSYRGTYSRSKNAYQSFGYTSPDGQLRALKVLLEENKRVKDYGFQASELKRANQSILARIEQQYNDRDKRESKRIVGEYIRNYLEGEPIPGIEVEYELYKKYLPTIKIEEVNALINNYIHDDNRVIIFTGPKKEGVEVPTEEQIRKLLKEVDGSKLDPYKDKAAPTSLVAKLPAKGSILSSEEKKEIGLTTMTLSNGAKLSYKKTDFKNDEILFGASSPGGTSLYSDEELAATTFANGGLSSAGIGGHSLTDIQKFMSGKIAWVRPTISDDGESFSGSAAPKDLETLFQMVYLYFTDLNKDEEAYQSYISKQKGFIGNLLADPGFYFSNAISEHRNIGNTRYQGFPTSEKLDNADYNLAYEKYKERFADAGDFHFYFVGNIDEEQIRAYAEQYIASLPGLNSNESYVSSKFHTADKFEKYVVKRGEDPKSRVNLSWQEEVELKDEEELALNALGEVLTIKLIEKLREEESGVYGVGARANYSKKPYNNASLSISFPCGPENVDKLIESALGEVKSIKEDGVQQKDLDKVKETYLVTRKEAIQTNRFWLNMLIQAERDSSDPEKVLKYEKAVKSLTTDQLQTVANKYLDDQYFLGILLPVE